MKTSDELEAVVLKIIEHGLLNIRVLGFSKGDAKACAIEADHLHNLPSLVQNCSAESLRYYLDVCRPAYIQAVGVDAVKALTPLWEQLENCAGTFNKET